MVQIFPIIKVLPKLKIKDGNSYVHFTLSANEKNVSKFKLCRIRVGMSNFLIKWDFLKIIYILMTIEKKKKIEKIVLAMQ